MAEKICEWCGGPILMSRYVEEQRQQQQQQQHQQQQQQQQQRQMQQQDYDAPRCKDCGRRPSSDWVR